MKKFGTVFGIGSFLLTNSPLALFVTLFVTSSVTIGGTAKASWGGPGSAAVPREKNAAPTFYKDVLPILQSKCQSCHRSGEPAPMPLVTYEQTRPWAGQIAAAVKMRMMPPWFADPRYGHFANDPSLSDEQIATIAAWKKAGAPPGDAHDAPRSAKVERRLEYSAARSGGQDASAGGDSSAGEVEYTYEIVATHFSEDKWVQMAELRPSSAAHVHHAVVYIRPPDSEWLRHAPVGVPFTASMLSDPNERRQAHETTSDLLLVYAPGSAPDLWADGMAKFVPAGSDLVFQMHYTTNGTATTDETSVGLVFAKSAPKQRVITLQLNNHAR